MRVLVTGATGFLGEHLVDALASSGHSVRAFARPTSRTRAIEALGAEVAVGSFTNPASLADATRGVDAVVHAAGGGMAGDASAMYRNNTDSTRALIEATRDAGCETFVLVSSLAARDAVSHYGKSKRAAELAALAHQGSMRVVVLRPPALYGPGEHRMVPLFRAAKRGFVPTVHPRGTLSMLHGADCADAIVCALASNARGVFFVAEERVYSRREMAELVGRAVGREVHVISVPPRALRLVARGAQLYGRLTDRPVFLSIDKTRDIERPHQCGDPTGAFEALDWRPRHDFEAGSVEAHADYRSRGWL